MSLAVALSRASAAAAAALGIGADSGRTPFAWLSGSPPGWGTPLVAMLKSCAGDVRRRRDAVACRRVGPNRLGLCREPNAWRSMTNAGIFDYVIQTHHFTHHDQGASFQQRNSSEQIINLELCLSWFHIFTHNTQFTCVNTPYRSPLSQPLILGIIIRKADIPFHCNLESIWRSSLPSFTRVRGGTVAVRSNTVYRVQTRL